MSVIVPDLRGAGKPGPDALRLRRRAGDRGTHLLPSPGRCHECIVEVTRGMTSASAPRTDAESFLRDPYRLACQAVIAAAACRPRLRPAAPPPADSDGRPARRCGATSIPLVTRRGGRGLLGRTSRSTAIAAAFSGIAIDFGTTTVVVELLDLETGAASARSRFENPQRFGGSDVMNRISYDSGPGAASCTRR